MGLRLRAPASVAHFAQRAPANAALSAQCAAFALNDSFLLPQKLLDAARANLARAEASGKHPPGHKADRFLAQGLQDVEIGEDARLGDSGLNGDDV